MPKIVDFVILESAYEVCLCHELSLNVKLLKQGMRRLYNPSQYSHIFSVISLAQWLLMQQRRMMLWHHIVVEMVHDPDREKDDDDNDGKGGNKNT
jgi:hypothetical protein